MIQFAQQHHSRLNVFISAQRKSIAETLYEIYLWRELVQFLVWRDLKVRYSQTYVGLAWIVIQPLVSLILFSGIFGKFMKIPSDGLPYPVFVVSGLVLWNFFANGMTNAASSLVNNANLVTKSYFARLAIPIAAILSSLVDFLIALVFAVIVVRYFQTPLSPKMLIVIPLVGVTFLAACGAGFLLAAVNVIYRDVKHIVPFLAQAWFFASPVIYSTNLLPPGYRMVMALNPMAGVIEGMHWSLGTTNDPWPMIGIAALVSVALFAIGILVFNRLEGRFADVV